MVPTGVRLGVRLDDIDVEPVRPVLDRPLRDDRHISVGVDLKSRVDELAGPKRVRAIGNSAFNVMVPVDVSIWLLGVSSVPVASDVRCVVGQGGQPTRPLAHGGRHPRQLLLRQGERSGDR